MNKFTLLLIGSLFSIAGSAATIKSAGSGNWGTASTWTPAVVPTCGDSVVIQSTHNVSVTSQQDYSGCSSYMSVVITGTLYFTGGNKLRLPCNSRVYLYAAAWIDSDGSGASNQLTICGT